MTGSSSMFGPDFIFGVATAAYQVEGAVDEDGRGTSIWDTFSHTPGAVFGGHTGDVACDQYHRFPDDLEQMRDLGVDSYRFSVAWPRIQPEGRGAVNARGLDHYERIVDALLEANIAPMLTLYHWDLPQALEDLGGWRVRDTAEHFADYAAIVHDRLGDRVARWTTLNEPFCSAFLGYAEGRHAPGAQEGHGALAAAHHLLLGHGLAARALRATGSEPAVGITLNLQPVTPISGSGGAGGGAERGLLYSNLLFTDPVLTGTYPELARETYGASSDFSFLREGDLEIISAPLDHLGVNYYFPMRVRAGEYREVDPARRIADDLGVEQVVAPEFERTDMGWPVDPGAFTELLLWMRERYPSLPPIYVTENGCAWADVVGEGGTVADTQRISYVEEHLKALARAVDAGVDVRGYYYWSLLDNFEWGEGYAKRFGLLYIDYDTQERIRKDSFGWFRRVIADQRAGGHT